MNKQKQTDKFLAKIFSSVMSLDPFLVLDTIALPKAINSPGKCEPT